MEDTCEVQVQCWQKAKYENFYFIYGIIEMKCNVLER